MDTNAWDKVQYDNKLENDKPVTSHKMVNCTEYLPETVWQNYVAELRGILQPSVDAFIKN